MQGSLSPKINQLFHNVLMAIQSSGLLTSPDILIDAMQNNMAILNSGYSRIDLVIHGNIPQSETGRLSKFITGTTDHDLIEILTGQRQESSLILKDHNLMINIRQADIPPPVKTGRLIPSATLLITDDLHDPERFQSLIARHIDITPILIVIYIGNVAFPPGIMQIRTEQSFIIRLINLADIDKYEALPKTTPLFSGNFHLFVTDYACLHMLDTIIVFFKLYVKQELNELTEKREAAMLQQVNLSQKAIDKYALNDQLQALKIQIQFFFADFEKGVKNNVENLLRYKTGSLWSKTNVKIDDLKELASEKKAKKVVFCIPEKFENDYFGFIYAELYQLCTADLQAMGDMFEIVNRHMEEEVTKLQMVSTLYYFKHITDLTAKRVLDAFVRMERPYKGEMRTIGGYEYFMSMRRYQMILYMVVSAFGVGYIIKRYEISIPLTIFLLGIGGYFVVKSVKKEKAETFTNELEKAKEILRSETRRIFSDFQREWINILAEHLRDQMQFFVQNADKQFKEFSQRLTSEQNEQKQILVKHIQGLEAKEKKKIALSDSVDVFMKNISLIKEERKQQLLQILNQTGNG